MPSHQGQQFPRRIWKHLPISQRKVRVGADKELEDGEADFDHHDWGLRKRDEHPHTGAAAYEVQTPLEILFR